MINSFPLHVLYYGFNCCTYSGLQILDTETSVAVSLKCKQEINEPVEMEMIVEVYTNSVSSKYTLEPIHRMMKSMGTPEEGQKKTVMMNHS